MSEQLCKSDRELLSRSQVPRLNFSSLTILTARLAQILRKGAVDSLGGALRVLEVLGVSPEDRFVHCDGALFALMLPFLEEGEGYSVPADKAVSFLKDIDSMSVSGHKML